MFGKLKDVFDENMLPRNLILRDVNATGPAGAVGKRARDRAIGDWSTISKT
jgi:hypothetical protein